MNWLKEYKSSLKNVHAEEFLDVYLYRPIAFVIVKTLYALPLTPNNYSFASFVAGFTSAFLFYRAEMEWGAFFFFLFAVLDCCDGMQARMKKNGSEFGRFIDGLVDYTSNIACYFALAYGVNSVYPKTGSIPTSYLIIAAGLSKALHSIMYDHYLMEYLSYDRGDFGFSQKELQMLKEKLKIAQQEVTPNKLRIFMLKTYISFTSLQVGKEENNVVKYVAKSYVEKNYRSIQLWGVLGPAWHITFLIIAFIFNKPEILFGYAIVFANVWLIFMYFYQQQIFKSLDSMKVKA